MDLAHILIMYNILLCFLQSTNAFNEILICCLIFHEDLLYNLDERKKNKLVIVYFYSLLCYKPYFMEMWRQFVRYYRKKKMSTGKTRNNVRFYMRQHIG